MSVAFARKDNRIFRFAKDGNPRTALQGATGLAICLLVVFAPGQLLAEKAGFEFFDPTHGQATHLSNVPLSVLQTFAPNAGFYPTPGAVDPDFRIIDIEVEASGPKPSDWSFSAVLLENTGKYDRKSWFFYNLTDTEVMDMAKVTGWIPLDIERVWVPLGGDWSERRWVVVFAECPEKYEYSILLDAKQETFEDELRRNMRPIDVDVFTTVPKKHKMFHHYDAVFVENTGANQIDTASQFMTLDDLDLMHSLGYQVIDFEPIAADQQAAIGADVVGYCVLVQNNGSWFSVAGDSQAVYEQEDQQHLRLNDLNSIGDEKFVAVFAHQNN